MTIAWMLYSLLVTTLLFLGAIAAEFVCRALRLPTRFVWAVALCASVGLSTRALVVTEPQAEAAVLSSVTAVDAGSVANGGEAGSDVVPAPSAAESSPIQSRLIAAAATAIEAPGRGIASLVQLTSGKADAPILIGLIATAVAGIAYLVAVAYRVRRIVGALEPSEIDGSRIFVSKRFGPALLGIVNPRIIIPRWVLSLGHGQRSVIVAHEKQHEDARDPAVLALGAAAVAIMPWNVVLWSVFARLRLAIEVDCDRRVLESHADAHSYGDLLVMVYERATPSRLRPAFAQGPSNLEQRIRRLVGRSPRLVSGRGGLALVGGVILVVVACETSPPTNASDSTSAGRPIASIVGTLPRCISGGRPSGNALEWFNEVTSLARQRHPEAFATGRTADWIVALVLDENCAVQQDTIIVSAHSDLAYPYFARVFGHLDVRRKVGMTWDRRAKLAIAYAVKASASWQARTETTPCGMGVRFDEHCFNDGPLEIRKLDSVHALVAVRAFNAANKPAEDLFLITLARPIAALATQSMAHGIVSYQSGALYLEDFLAREPLLWVGTKTSTGLTSVKRKRDVRVVDELIGIAHYRGHPLTLEQVAQLQPAAKCDGPAGSCYEVAGTEIKFP